MSRTEKPVGKKPASRTPRTATSRSAAARPARARTDTSRTGRTRATAAPAHARGSRTSGGRHKPANQRVRYYGLGIVFCLMATVTVGKLTDLQVINPNRYRATGVEQRTERVELPAARGAIMDRNGQDLAVSIPRATVYADPAQVSDVEAEAALLAEILDMDVAEVADLLRTDSRFVYLARTVSDSVADEIAAASEAGDLDGIELLTEYERERPNGDDAQSLLGLTDVDGVGISGLEAQFDSLLEGTPGEISTEISSMGPIPGGQREIEAAAPGGDLELTIDLPLQHAAERLVADQVQATDSASGIAIITRPETGEVLAMVNVTADPETGRASPSTNNEALTTVFEPGSVNKVITVAAALADGKVDPGTVLQHTPTLTLGGATFSEAEALPSQLSVADIITVSSNIGTIKLAQMLGAERVDQALRNFGFGRLTALEFPNESPGLMLDVDDWSGSSIGSIPIGQGVSVTAMQMLQAYNVLANDGVAVPARLVNARIDAEGRRHTETSGEGTRVVSETVARQVRGMLAHVVSTGTGTQAAVPGYQVAGKTGTARMPLDEHQSGDGYLDLQGRYHYVSSFVGMLPAGDPQLSIIVVLNDVDRSRTGSYFASATAAPLFGQLASKAVRRLHIPPATGPDPTDGLPVVDPDLLASVAQ